MRSRIATLVVALTLLVSAGSLITTEVEASGAERFGCCICAPCVENSTMSGLDPLDSAQCAPAATAGECPDICDSQGCGFETFENVTCNDPSVAEACGDPFVMAPAASTLGLLTLIALLSGFGAFYLRRRAA